MTNKERNAEAKAAMAEYMDRLFPKEDKWARIAGNCLGGLILGLLMFGAFLLVLAVVKGAWMIVTA